MIAFKGSQSDCDDCQVSGLAARRDGPRPTTGRQIEMVLIRVRSARVEDEDEDKDMDGRGAMEMKMIEESG